jgi:SNF2 family DNA or RNA helicase
MMAQEIPVTKIGNRWIARSTYEQRAIPRAAGFRWDTTNKQWYTEDPAIAAKLSTPDAAKILTAEAQAKEAAKIASIAASRASNADVDLPAPDGLSYLSYQRAGIAYGLSHPNVLFGDDMGLGKTIQAIGVINADSSIRKVLIVCPASLKLNWAQRAKKMGCEEYDDWHCLWRYLPCRPR